MNLKRLISTKLTLALILSGGLSVPMGLNELADAQTNIRPTQTRPAPVTQTPVDPEMALEIREALQDFRQEVRNADRIMNQASGLLVFPDVYEGAYIIGAEYGRGALLVNGRVVNQYRLASGSVGFQIGGQKKTIILAFMTPQALANFRRAPEWQIGADASAAILTAGAEGAIDVTALNKPILGFVLDQKGLMAGVSLEGTRIWPIR